MSEAFIFIEYREEVGNSQMLLLDFAKAEDESMLSGVTLAGSVGSYTTTRKPLMAAAILIIYHLSISSLMCLRSGQAATATTLAACCLSSVQ